MVTGASSGIGRALALELARLGYRVGLIARRKDVLEEVARQIAAHGGTARAAAADVGDRQALQAAVRELESALGPTEVMVANAGLRRTDASRPHQHRRRGGHVPREPAGRHLLDRGGPAGPAARGRGQLVAISSLAAFKGVPGESAYCASKAAVNVFMEGLRIALRAKGIAVLTVCPGFVDTPILPMDTPTPFMISAESAARRIARLIVGRKSGLVAFPWPMAALTAILRRFPDFLVARILGFK